VATAVLNPIYGRLADRRGARRLTIAGLIASGAMLPVLGRAWSFESTLVLYILQASAVALVITPSLAYMAEATSDAGIESFGVSYGLYNFAWGAGLLGGLALGGFLFERMGFTKLSVAWAPAMIVAAVLLGRVKSRASETEES
jgi:MFS family permease